MQTIEQTLSQTSLLDFEKDITQEIIAASKHPNQMKAAVMLSILADESMKALGTIDTSKMFEQVYNKVEELRKKHTELLPQLEEHRKQNRIIVDNIDEATSQLIHLDEEIACQLEEYDKLLGELVKARDALPIEDLKPSSSPVE